MSLLSFDSITKRYEAASRIALDGVSIAFEAGSIHALLGENGAGKTTLVSILAGLIASDAGTIRLDDVKYAPRSPREALARGVGLVHQHDRLIRELTVAENLELARADGRRLLSRDAMLERARADAQTAGLELPDPARVVATLSVGERQRVETIAVLAAKPRVVLFDEPTAVLTPDEATALQDTLRRLAQDGAAVVLITHRLSEVLACADRVTVLRRGSVVVTTSTQGVDEARLATWMVGELPVAATRASRTATGEEALALAHVDARAASNAVQDVSLEVARGEIVGIAGVDGNGQRALFEVIAGLALADAGRITLRGDDVTKAAVAARRTRGLALVSEDRLREGVIGSFAIEDALLLSTVALDETRSGSVLSPARVRERATAAIDAFEIAADGARAPCSSLSGGHQQRVVLARELRDDAVVLLAHNPTRGLDVRAAQFVRERIAAFAAAGGAVLWIGSDLDEIAALADRLHVLHRGALSRSLARGTSGATIGRLLAGGIE